MRVAVYAGSSPGALPEFMTAADAVGRSLARAGVGLVYGGASVGLMGAVADGALAAGGEVIGVLPGELFSREIQHQGLTRLEVVGSLHERKALMAELADGFAALPGGLGTLDELFEVLTWRQLGLHDKPIVLVDVAGYCSALVALLDAQVAAGFVQQASLREALLVADVAGLLPAFGLG
jgi:uncharacterized protein (TIGR00730 family)